MPEEKKFTADQVREFGKIIAQQAIKSLSEFSISPLSAQLQAVLSDQKEIIVARFVKKIIVEDAIRLVNGIDVAFYAKRMTENENKNSN